MYFKYKASIKLLGCYVWISGVLGCRSSCSLCYFIAHFPVGGKLLSRKTCHHLLIPCSLQQSLFLTLCTDIWKINTFFSISWHISSAFLTLFCTGWALSCLHRHPCAHWLPEPPSGMCSLSSKALQTAAVQSEPRGDPDLINGLQLTKLKENAEHNSPLSYPAAGERLQEKHSLYFLINNRIKLLNPWTLSINICGATGNTFLKSGYHRQRKGTMLSVLHVTEQAELSSDQGVLVQNLTYISTEDLHDSEHLHYISICCSSSA